MTEDQLRDQLRRVDDLTPPPAPDFAARAMGASARRGERRRSWGKAVLGAAAAIAIGTLAVTNLSRPSTAGSSASGVAAGAPAPEVATDDATRATPLDTTPGPDHASTAPGPGSTAAVTTTTRLFTGADCASTLTGVRAAVPTLRQQGLAVISAACDQRGVVVLRVGATPSPPQRSILTARYGPRVSVAGPDGTPLP